MEAGSIKWSIWAKQKLYFAEPPYLGVIGLELELERRRGLNIFGFAEAISNLSAGLGTLVIGLFSGPYVLALWNHAYSHWAPFHWPADSLWRWPFALLLSDFCYYVYHRAGHQFGLLWAIHGVHHQHERLNSTVGLRLEWFADFSTIFFFGLMPLMGIDAETGFLTIAALSLYTLTTHSPVLQRPTFGIFVTPATHGSHHSRDVRYMGFNFGAMFAIWDRIFGTHLEPDKGDSLHDDLPTICRVHNGVSAQWSLISELRTSLANAPDFRSALRILFTPPTFDDVTQTKTPRDVAVSPGAKVYLLMDFLGVVGFAAWLLWLRERHPWHIQLGGALVVIWGLRTIGGLLDGRARALREEALRLVATLALAVAAAPENPAVSLGVASGALVLLLALATQQDALQQA
jgi:sterol desaturase/sphingolipid hydroxylase (fatty acid hydroxylase superfamily)